MKWPNSLTVVQVLIAFSMACFLLAIGLAATVEGCGTPYCNEGCGGYAVVVKGQWTCSGYCTGTVCAYDCGCYPECPVGNERPACRCMVYGSCN